MSRDFFADDDDDGNPPYCPLFSRPSAGWSFVQSIASTVLDVPRPSVAAGATVDDLPAHVSHPNPNDRSATVDSLPAASVAVPGKQTVADDTPLPPSSRLWRPAIDQRD
jgi:hypothetical protein